MTIRYHRWNHGKFSLFHGEFLPWFHNLPMIVLAQRNLPTKSMHHLPGRGELPEALMSQHRWQRRFEWRPTRRRAWLPAELRETLDRVQGRDSLSRRVHRARHDGQTLPFRLFRRPPMSYQVDRYRSLRPGGRQPIGGRERLEQSQLEHRFTFKFLKTIRFCEFKLRLN